MVKKIRVTATQDYVPNFQHYGTDSIEECCSIDERQFKEWGIALDSILPDPTVTFEIVEVEE